MKSPWAAVPVDESATAAPAPSVHAPEELILMAATLAMRQATANFMCKGFLV